MKISRPTSDPAARVCSTNRILRARRHRSRFPLPGLLILLLSFCVCSPAIGQDDYGMDETNDNSVFVTPPRELLRPLRKAETAVREEKWTDAVELLGEILSDEEFEDFLIPSTEDENRVVSLRNHITAKLGSIPAEHRNTYRLRFGIRAGQMLDEAVGRADYATIRRVMDSFFYTEAGYTAAMLAGHHYLEEGRPISAASCFRRIVRTVEARNLFDPEASVLLATCQILSNSEDDARRVLEDLKSRQRSGTITFGGREVPLFRESDPVDWLRDLIGDSPIAGNALVHDWIMFRGNPQRNASGMTGMPLMLATWSLPTLNDPALEKEIRKQQKQFVIKDSSAIPGVHPLAIGNTVIMRTFDRMIGVDFQTGKRQWVYPPFDNESFHNVDDTEGASAPGSLNGEAAAQRLWSDSVFGQVSSDSRYIFAVPQPGFAGGARARTRLRGGTVIEDPLGEREWNELIAVDMNRQGEFRWRVGGEKGWDEPELAGAFFLGPPLPIERNLYAICELREEIQLVCLQAETGKLLWSQQLASSEQTGSVRNNTFRRLAGATPSFSDGLLVCPTGVGAVVAMDLATRSLIWGYQYSSTVAVRGHGLGRRGSAKTVHNDRNNAWQDSSITIASGTVFCTPVESQQLIALDLLTGKPKWEKDGVPARSLDRRDSLFLGGVPDNRVILVGKNRIRALSLVTGEQLWSTRLGNNGAPSGCGYSADGFYYLPTTESQLLKIDTASGEIVKSIRTAGILGNLICHKGNVISHGVDHVAAFPLDQPYRERIASAELLGNLDADMKALKAQLFLQDRRYRDAAEILMSAYEENPRPTWRTLLLELSQQLLVEDVEYGSELANRLATRSSNENFSTVASARVDGMIRQQSYETAAQSIVAFLSETIDRNFLADKEIEVHRLPAVVDPETGRLSTLKMKVRNWTNHRTNLIAVALRESGEDAALDSLKNDIADLFKSLPQEPVDKRLTFYRSVDRQLIPVELKQTLLADLRSTGDRTSSRLVAVDLAGYQYDLEIASIGEEYLSNLEEEIRSAVSGSAIPDREELDRWSTGRVQTEVVEQSLDDRDAFYRRYSRNTLELLSTTDESAKEFLFRFYSASGELELVDRYGNMLRRIALRNDDRHTYRTLNVAYTGDVRVKDGVLAIRLGTELFLLDWARLLQQETSPLIWSTDLRKQNGGLVSPRTTYDNAFHHRQLRTQSIPYVLPGGGRVCYIEEAQLVCLDYTTGTELWKSGRLRFDMTLLGEGEQVFAWDARERIGYGFDIRTGEMTTSMEIEPEVGSLWTTRGSSMLMATVNYESAPDGADEAEEADGQDEPEDEDAEAEEEFKQPKIMLLFDFAEGKTIWSREYDPDTCAATVRDEEIIVVTGDGIVEIVDIGSGEVRSSVSGNLPIDPGTGKVVTAKQINVVSLERDYVIQLNTSASRTTRYSTINNIELRYVDYYRTFWNGYTLAIDRATGKPRWSKPARTQFLQYARNVPWSSPVLVMMRRLSRPGVPSRARYFSQIVAIDLRDGRLVENVQTSLSVSSDYRIEVNPQFQRLDFVFPNKICRMRWTDETPPPAPVAHITGENSFHFEPVFEFNPVIDEQQIGEQREKLIERIRNREKDLEQRRDEMRRIMQKQLESPDDEEIQDDEN